MAVDGDTLREIMLHAYDLDLINGDYAFINIIPFRDEQLFGDDSWERVSGLYYSYQTASVSQP